MTEQKLIHPTIHLNGTSKAELSRTYVEAMNAVRSALVKTRQTVPHDRDYYPQGHDALRAAQQQHEARCKALETVLNELAEIVLEMD